MYLAAADEFRRLVIALGRNFSRRGQLFLMFLIGLLAGFLAFTVGRWRHTCIFLAANNRANVPLRWRNPGIQIGSWLLVAMLSLVFAASWSLLIHDYVNELLGMFGFGVLLVFRWVVSGLASKIGN